MKRLLISLLLTAASFASIGHDVTIDGVKYHVSVMQPPDTISDGSLYYPADVLVFIDRTGDGWSGDKDDPIWGGDDTVVARFACAQPCQASPELLVKTAIAINKTK